MKILRIGVVLSFFLLVNLGSVCYTYYPDLSDEQMQEAIQYGRDNKDVDFVTFAEEWVFVTPELPGWGYLVTPFFLLADRARIRAMQYQILTDDDKKIIEMSVHSLRFWFVVYGDTPTFGEDYYAVLLYKDSYVKPAHIKNEESAKWDEEMEKYRGDFVCLFPLKFTVGDEDINLDPNTEIALMILRGKDDGGIGIKFDLSSIR